MYIISAFECHAYNLLRTVLEVFIMSEYFSEVVDNVWTPHDYQHVPVHEERVFSWVDGFVIVFIKEITRIPITYTYMYTR